MTPNKFDVVKRVSEANAHLLKENRENTIIEFMTIVVLELRKEDKEWHWLSKDAGGEHITINGHKVATDAIIYKKTNQVVDIISNALNKSKEPPPPAAPAWQEVPKRASDNPIDVFKGSVDNPPVSEIAQLKKEIAELRGKLDSLESRALVEGSRVGLLADNGRKVCADFNHEGHLIANRDNFDGWETFTVLVKR